MDFRWAEGVVPSSGENEQVSDDHRVGHYDVDEEAFRVVIVVGGGPGLVMTSIRSGLQRRTVLDVVRNTSVE